MMAVDINVVTAGAKDTIYLAAGGKAVPANQFGNGVRCVAHSGCRAAVCERSSWTNRGVIAPRLAQGNAFGFEITP